MAIIATDIQYRLSGGSSNTDPTISFGGVKSTTSAGSNVFDDVTSAEAAAGATEYRCLYVHNNHGSLTYTAPKFWIDVQTPSADTVLAVGVGAAAVNGTETAPADAYTAPASVVFSAPSSLAGGLALGDLPAGQHRAVWVRRTTTAGAAVAADGFTIKTSGDTLP